MPDIESSRPGLVAAAMNENTRIRNGRGLSRALEPLDTQEWGSIIDAILEAIPSVAEGEHVGTHDVRDVDLDGAIRDEIAETFFDREARVYVLVAESHLREEMTFPDSPRDTGRLHIIASNGTSSAHIRGLLETAIDGLRSGNGSLE